MFSTSDRDNDIHVTKTCSIVKKSGWWHGKCTNVNINGLLNNVSDPATNIYWKTWRMDGITKTRMMIKPKL